MSSKPHILLVDDERDLIRLLKDVFRRFEPYILYAHSGNEAIEILKSKSVGLIISDYQMADGDGGELLKFVRKIDTEIPFYLHTAADPQRIQVKAHNGLFEKPNGLKEIIKTIEDYLGSDSGGERR